MAKAKKKRTAKQKAASKRNIKKAIAAQGKKVHKAVKRSTRSVAKKKKSKGGKRSPGKKSFIDKIPILNNKTVQKVGFGLGMGVVVTQLIELAARFGPPAIAQPLQQNKQIIKLATEFASEPISAVVDIVLNPQMLSNITGRMSGNGQQSVGQNMVGFA